MPFSRYIKDWVNNNPGKAFGALIGIIISILFLTFGIKTIIIILFALLGLIIGKLLDDDATIFIRLKDIFKRRR